MDSSDHSGIYTFVVRDKVEPGALDFIIGIFGRNNRDLDSKELGIIFVHVHSASWITRIIIFVIYIEEMLD